MFASYLSRDELSTLYHSRTDRQKYAFYHILDGWLGAVEIFGFDGNKVISSVIERRMIDSVMSVCVGKTFNAHNFDNNHFILLSHCVDSFDSFLHFLMVFLLLSLRYHHFLIIFPRHFYFTLFVRHTKDQLDSICHRNTVQTCR